MLPIAVSRKVATPVFFLVRTVFWLSIVFSSMAWTLDAAPSPPHALRDVLVEGGRTVAGEVREAALGRAETWCVKDVERCLHDAARLGALVSATLRTDTDLLPAGPAAEAVLPLPPADPRRHGASAGLTRSP